MIPLRINGLTVARRVGGGLLLDDVSIEVARGEVVGLVGESGSGKSLTALAAIGMLPHALVQTAGEIHVDGHRLADLGRRDLIALRRTSIALVFQDPMTALNPTRRIGLQVMDVLAASDLPRAERRDRAIALMAEMDLPDPPSLLERYPHQLSGGQRQRVLIAMAFAANPAIVIADEVTTALDVSVRGLVLELLTDRARRAGSGLLLITHDLGAARHSCDRVVVMAKGRVTECGSATDVFGAPKSREARTLLAALPERGRYREPLPVGGDEP